MAMHRLKLLERKLDRDSEYAELFYREMDRLFEKGYAEPAKELIPGQPLWYLPCFGVQNPNKPGKVRLVFDASAKSSGVSFNDLLLKGPELLKSLIGVLMRFRQFAVASKADMRDMFLKVKLRDFDQNAQRFLWRGRDRDVEPKEYISSSLLFGGKSSPSEAIFIKNKNANDFAEKYPQAAKSVINNSYVDDYLDSCLSEEQAIERIRQVIEINSAANWDMHGWACNVEDVLKGISDQQSNPNTVQLKLEGENSHPSGFSSFNERVLGINWRTFSDDFGFQLGENKIDSDIRNFSRVPSKREFLKIIMSVFDPLGFLSPLTIRSRILMQEVWATKIGWDERLREKEFQNWKLWLNDLVSIRDCSVPRCYQLKGHVSIEPDLHVFCDASEKAFAAVAYWKFTYPNNESIVSFIIAKSRVAPSKPTTIPRLELQAALIGVRIAKTIVDEHDFKIKNRYFWSDSKTVLCWINSDPKIYKTFVANRLGEIREESSEQEWRWVPSLLNPADDAIRLAPDSLCRESRWLCGPSFLLDSEITWPEKGVITTTLQALPEVQEREEFDVRAFVVSVDQSEVLPDSSRFSSWSRLIGATSRVLEACDRFRKKHKSKTKLEWLESAETLWFKRIQLSSFAKELGFLSNRKTVEKNSKLSVLTPISDEQGLMRVNGRVKPIPGNQVDFMPIILDAKHSVTKLLVKNYHVKFFHASHETVLNEIRQKFWIIGIRKQLRFIIFSCTDCKLARARPANPQMAILPRVRLGFKLRPFSFCGIDYFGPIKVRVLRSSQKHWGVLVICLTTRAIHLELVDSLNTDSTIMAIQRVAAIRGFPLIIYSDNGTNFKGADKELRDFLKTMNEKKHEEFALKNKFVWRFNPPTAAHMGGSWERQIRSVKNALKFVLKDRCPREVTLRTALAEIQHSINSRPLTHVSPDPNDKEALTPNHFLLGSSSGTVNFGCFEPESVDMRKQWRIAQIYANEFWSRWLTEYLPSLVPRKKWQEKGENLAEGDLVLILDDQIPRNEWKKGVVIRLIPSSDEEVRAVELRTSNGILTRPTRKLIKFGVQNL